MINKWLFFITSMIVSSLLSVSLAADNQTINFAVNLVAPSCEVGQSGLGSGNVLDFGNINPASVASVPPAAMLKVFQLTLHDCNTQGSPGQKPKLKLTSANTCTTSNCGSWGNAMFNDGLGAKGIGFIVRMNDTLVDWTSGGSHYRNDPNDEIELATGVGSAAPAMVNIAVGITSGSGEVALAAGDLKAAVTFTFRYG